VLRRNNSKEMGFVQRMQQLSGQKQAAMSQAKDTQNNDELFSLPLSPSFPYRETSEPEIGDETNFN
jgi:hypothetical protein